MSNDQGLAYAPGARFCLHNCNPYSKPPNAATWSEDAVELDRETLELSQLSFPFYSTANRCIAILISEVRLRAFLA